MNIETKTVRGDFIEYTYFGWEYTDDTRVRHGRLHFTEHILARNKDMDNYQTIVECEEQYFALKSQIKYYERMDGLLLIIGFCLFIIPGFIYFIYKSKQKAEIESYNATIKERMDNILAKVKAL